MHKLYTLLLFCFFALSVGFELKAQLYTSPYSRMNFGDIIDNLQSVNSSMGGIGISNSRLSYVPHYNPAQLSTIQLTHIETSLITERRVKNKETSTETSNGSAIGNITMAFPIIASKWGFSMSLQPISLTSFSQDIAYDSRKLEGYELSFTERISSTGGLSSFYIASGINLLNDLSIGTKISYLFGDVKLSYEYFPSSTDSINFSKTEGVFDWNVSDILIELGSKYSYRINENKKLNLGLIYQFPKELQTNKIVTSNLYVSGRFTPLLTKELSKKDEKIKYPSLFGLGISYEANKSWIVGFDYRTRNWSNSNINDFEQINYRIANSYYLGVEYIPQHNNVDNYFKRVIYRAGISYVGSPWLVLNQEVNEISYNAGISFPLRSYSLLNLGFTYGTRGSQIAPLIQETFYRFTLGISFNDQWFLKRQLN